MFVSWNSVLYNPGYPGTHPAGKHYLGFPSAAALPSIPWVLGFYRCVPTTPTAVGTVSIKTVLEDSRYSASAQTQTTSSVLPAEALAVLMVYSQPGFLLAVSSNWPKWARHGETPDDFCPSPTIKDICFICDEKRHSFSLLKQTNKKS